ncbi:LCP family protein [Streptomyces sp. NBC_00820]|uniref:LCP family protein n=1 Tax=Streptomyces sp. NBC_00820 TaxID=2975842 RepID=UPI002ED1ACED|nr:LCP family protein [Streptomyces sp. NBC_00820]
MTDSSVHTKADSTPPAGNGRPGKDASRRERDARRDSPRRGGRILRWSAASLALLLLGTAGAGYLYYEHLNHNIKKAKLNLGESAAPEATPNAAGQTPMNILLIGSDSRNTARNLKLGGSRNDVGRPPLADVQMLVHISADRSNMSVVSLPRDTMIPIPKCTDPKNGHVYDPIPLAMANRSLERGGPGCTVATWTELTHHRVHIDHFMMVDFSGVVDMADAIGGVPVCVDQNVWSRHGSGLKLRKGKTKVMGEQALQWLRTRYGFEDGTDIGRTHAQHMYMNSMVRELRKNAQLGNPAEMRKLAEAATSALVVDEGLDTIKKLYDLMGEMQKVPTKRITTTTLPVVEWPQDRNRRMPAPGNADQVLSMISDDTPMDGRAAQHEPEQQSTDDAAPAADIAVQVRNGTGSATRAPAPQRGDAIAQVLQGKGFTKALRDSTAASETDTVIQFPSADLEGDAQAVAKALGIPPGHVHKSTDVSGITLTVGADWRTGDAYPKGTTPNKLPASAAVQHGDEEGCMKVQEGYTW